MSDSVSLLDQVLELVYLLDDDMRRGLEREGLTPSRVPLTWALHQHGPATQRSLATALSVSPRNVTGLVDALAETGFVTREPHPTDRRATLVTLTTRGDQVMRRLASQRVELADQLFADLSTTRRRDLARSLDHVLVALRAQLGGSEEVAGS